MTQKGGNVHIFPGTLYLLQSIAAAKTMDEYQAYAALIGCVVEYPDLIMVDTPEQAKLLAVKWKELTDGRS